MFLLDGRLITSASDLSLASKCEFAFLRGLDARLGRVEALAVEEDPMLVRTGRLGDEHEARVLDRYREQGGVAEIERPSLKEPGALEDALTKTKQAFDDHAQVVFQATFFDDGFIGFADFIVRQPDGRYRVQDTKLARSAKVTALLQLAAYAEQLERIGVPLDDHVDLLLGDGTVSIHRLADIAPVYRNRRRRLLAIVDEHMGEQAEVQWGDARYTVCAHCDHCSAEIEQHRDPLLVAGLRVTQRARLAEAGIRTIDELAEGDEQVDGISPGTLANLRAQARLQVAPHDGPPLVDFHTPQAIADLPAPDAGDIFFDFEGDPLYTEGSAQHWGLDYLFGLVDAGEQFVAFWAHDHHEERVALREFLDYVAARRAICPNLHIYHYASYERTHLLSLAARHGIGEHEVDDLLRENVLVDLYPVVRKALRLGSRSYSIKKLEPLYMGADHRGDVSNAAQSIDEYARYAAAGARGEDAEAQRILGDIADYNRYDCVSTLRLRDWLLAQAAERGIHPHSTDLDLDIDGIHEPSALNLRLLELAGDPLSDDRTTDQDAYALAAAAIDYHRREQKSFWWDHFARLIDPMEQWEETRDVFRVDAGEVVEDWHKIGKQRTERRHLRLRGTWAPGSGLPQKPHAVYEAPGPFVVDRSTPGSRPFRETHVLDADDGWVLIEETRPPGVDAWDVFPSALTPAKPPAAGAQVGAIEVWGQAVADAAPDWPTDAVVDLLRRTPPRTRSGALAEGEPVEAVIASLLDLDSSYLAVQGPPGTGKTYLASHVIARLVEQHQWKIGVVAQSHAVVENVLGGIIRAGLSPRHVGKTLRADASDEEAAAVPFVVLPGGGQAAFAAENEASGFVVGGTAWTFANPKYIPRRSLDLLVIDEAGQFSLAATIAASVAAQNLLLLGDPQQLPQVSQGTHPAPVDQSALGYISAGHDVLPPELGIFLAQSRRMDVAVTAPVSALSYEGELHSHACTTLRHLDGIAPGLHIREIDHVGNATSSVEEAAVVVDLVRTHLGLPWTDGDPRPLAQRDVIVVSPYNAQVQIVSEALAAAGFDRVRVGTVDKFQGQEAVLSIVTLAASSPAEVPRGLSFLLMKNRLNVAISRAQWAAFLLFSPALVEHLPATPSGVAELSAFMGLVEAGMPEESGD